MIEGPAPGDGRSHLRYLDGLRGVAILMVVLVHVGLRVPGLPGPVAAFTFYGLHGVQLFFVVSGLTLVVAHGGRRFRPGPFALRRLLRIAPMFYAGAALYLGVGRFTTLPYAPRDVRWPELAATLLFVHGWLPHACNKIVPGGWSIAAEAMFYCVFPLLLALAARRRLGAAVAVSFVLAGAANLALKRLTAGDPAAEGFAFYFWLCQLPAFALGCWLADGPGHARLTRSAAAWAMAAVAAALAVDSQLGHRTNLLVAILLLGGLAWTAGRARPGWLEGAALPFLGRVSFSLYLLHFLALALAAPWIERSGLPPLAALPLLYALTLALAVPAAWAGFVLVERPAVRLGRRLTNPAAG